MQRLKQIAEQIGKQKLPPVHLWHPDYVGEIDIEIDIHGFWFHEGEPFQRGDLVRLFASILVCEDGQHYLKTPVEKLAIKVADSPFVIHQAEYVDDTWVVVTNTHEQLFIGQGNPVELRLFDQQYLPYVRVRDELWARANRSIYYQWVSEALTHQKLETDELVLSSGAYSFEVARVE